MLQFFQSPKANDAYHTLLINNLRQTAQELQDAYVNLENAVEPDLIDCYIYKVNSVQMRYKFLLEDLKHYEAMHKGSKKEDFYARNPLEV